MMRSAVAEAVAVHWEILAQWCDEILLLMLMLMLLLLLLLLLLCLDSARATLSVHRRRESAPIIPVDTRFDHDFERI